MRLNSTRRGVATRTGVFRLTFASLICSIGSTISILNRRFSNVKRAATRSENETVDLKLSGKTALILGGSKGIGKGIATALAAEGVAVALVARDPQSLDSAVSEIESRGGKAIGLAADLGHWPTIENAVATARTQLGPIDILLNNSGGPPPSGVIGVSPEVWETQFRTMVLSLFRVTELVLPDMRARKFGRILNVTSHIVVEPIVMIGISSTLRSAIHGWARRSRLRSRATESR